MAKQTVVVVLFCAVMLGHCRGKSFELVVHPAEVVPGFTEVLTVNCSLQYGSLPQISSLLALSILKSEHHNDDRVELVSLHTFGQDQVSVLSEIYNASISGHVAEHEDSFLSLEWTYPSGIEGSLFFCESRGLDNEAHIVISSIATQLSIDKPSVDELILKVIEVQSKLSQKCPATNCDSLQTELEQVKQDHDSIVSTLRKEFEDMERGYTDSISSLLDELEQGKKTCDEKVSNLQAELEDLKNHAPLSDQSDPPFDLFSSSGTYNNHLYLLSNNDWNDAAEAEASCENVGGYLAEIDDEAEYVFVKEFLEQSDRNVEFVLLGGNDEAEENHWTFRFSGQPVVFTDWYTGRPLGLDWDCQTIGRPFRWKMFDHSCAHAKFGYKFLCEKEAAETVATTPSPA